MAAAPDTPDTPLAIDLGDGTMMEAYGRHAGIRSVLTQYGGSYIAPYVKRPFG